MKSARLWVQPFRAGISFYLFQTCTQSDLDVNVKKFSELQDHSDTIIPPVKINNLFHTLYMYSQTTWPACSCKRGRERRFSPSHAYKRTVEFETKGLLTSSLPYLLSIWLIRTNPSLFHRRTAFTCQWHNGIPLLVYI